MSPEPSPSESAAGTRQVTSPAIEAEVVRWSRLIVSIAARHRIDAADLSELVQDVRIRVWRALEARGEKSEPLGSSYMYQLTMSATVDLVRRQRRRTYEVLHETIEAEQSVTSEQVMTTVLNDALMRLAVDRRLAVRMHLEGKSLSEIGTMLNWTPARARNLLYRGLDDLKSLLSAS